MSTKRWLEYEKRRGAADTMNAAARGGGGGGGSCEEVCKDHGGVEDCGERFASCGDGTAWLIDP